MRLTTASRCGTAATSPCPSTSRWKTCRTRCGGSRRWRQRRPPPQPSRLCGNRGNRSLWHSVRCRAVGQQQFRVLAQQRSSTAAAEAVQPAPGLCAGAPAAQACASAASPWQQCCYWEHCGAVPPSGYTAANAVMRRPVILSSRMQRASEPSLRGAARVVHVKLYLCEGFAGERGKTWHYSGALSVRG